MIEPTRMAFMLTCCLLLFFSIHLYREIRMLQLVNFDRSKIYRKEGFVFPSWAGALVFFSTTLFWIAFIVSPLLFYFGKYERIFAPVLIRCSHENAFQVAGLGFVLAGVLLADWGRVSRGPITPSRAMPEDYKLSTHGAYSIVRHPLYLSYFLFFVGLPLALLNILIFLCVLGIPGYYGVAKAEEKILIEKFGHEYIEYQKKVGMFFPTLKG